MLERARELASLRVLGFTRWEAMRIPLLELAILPLIAQPPGWALGFMTTRLPGELMRVPMIMQNLTFAIASAAVTASIVARRVAAVFAVRDGRAQLTLVAIGQRNEKSAEVVSGLAEGDQVIVHPSDRVSDGVAVSQR